MYIGYPRRNRPFVKHLIGYYPFDADFNDKIAPFVDLTVSDTGSITLSPAVLGNGANSPAGTNTALRNVSSPDRHKFSFTDGTNDLPFSISMHIKLISAGGTTGFILGKHLNNSGSADGNTEWWLQVNPALSTISFAKWSLGSSANGIRKTINAPALNVWHHLVITDDAAGNTKIYVNGSLQIPATTTDGTGFVKFSQTAGSNFGCFNALGVPSSTRYFQGGIDDLGIFKNYVLTQEDIDWIWNGGSPRRLKNVS